MKSREIVIGKRYGKLVVLRYFGMRPAGKYHERVYECKCDCGAITYKSTGYLNSKYNHCCEKCNNERLGKQTKTHGLSYTRIYNIYRGIIKRCYCEKQTYYKHYGGRGIKMCDEWRNDFVAFYNWAMEHGYNDTLTIDRINNDGNYEPSNCRFITKHQQEFNKRTNVFIEMNGETKTITEWCNELKIDRYKVYRQYKKYVNRPKELFEKCKELMKNEQSNTKTVETI